MVWQAEPESSEPSALKDDEGTEASSKDVTDSINKAVVRNYLYPLPNTPSCDMFQDDDSPKDAYAAEAGEQKEATPAPSSEASGDKAISEKTEAPGKHEQKEKSGKEKDASGTLQSKEDSGPSDVGDARKQAKVRYFIALNCMTLILTHLM